MNKPLVKLLTTVDSAGILHCQLNSSLPCAIERPVICFSLLSPAEAIVGCTLLESVGGYTAVQLKSALPAGGEVNFSVAYRGSFFPNNRAWLPLGAYIRSEELDSKNHVPIECDTAGVIELDHKKHAFQSPASPMINLVPMPTRWQAQAGNVAVNELRISCVDALSTVAERVNGLALRCGFSDFLSDTGTPTSITVSPSLASESYCLNIQDTHIDIEAADDTGVFYALVTLLNLRELNDGLIEIGVLEDSPRFVWRGQHLDCARHFYQVDTIIQLLDLMALLKLNRFHWHVSDDEAFRLQIDTVKELWQQSSFRGEAQLLPGVFGGGAGPTGGSYSKGDIQRIVSHAKSVCIEVMPEVEFPAHALCMNRVYPMLRDTHDSGVEMSVQGYTRNVVNPAKQECMDLFESLVEEIAELFPFAHLHLGGDELPKGSWNGSPIMSEYKQANRLDSDADVMGFAMNRLGSYVRQQGEVPCAWEESAGGIGGGIGNDALLFLWLGTASFAALASAGYRCVLCPAQPPYMDMAHPEDQSDWGATWAATIGRCANASNGGTENTGNSVQSMESTRFNNPGRISKFS